MSWETHKTQEHDGTGSSLCCLNREALGTEEGNWRIKKEGGSKVRQLKHCGKSRQVDLLADFGLAGLHQHMYKYE